MALQIKQPEPQTKPRKKKTKRSATVLKVAYYRAADSLAEDNKRNGQSRDACDRHLADLKRAYFWYDGVMYDGSKYCPWHNRLRYDCECFPDRS